MNGTAQPNTQITSEISLKRDLIVEFANPLTEAIDKVATVRNTGGILKDDYSLYALELVDHFYYVGLAPSVGLTKRLLKHSVGLGAEFTKAFPPVQLLEIRRVGQVTSTTAEAYEQLLTEAYVDLFGIRHVRGGKWVSVMPPDFFSWYDGPQPKIAGSSV